MTFSKTKDFLFRVLNGFKGVAFEINGSTVRFDESLRRWNFDSELDMLKIIQQRLKPGNTYVDIGANFGLHALYAAALLNNEGNIYAFEPLPQNISILKKNISLNKFSNINIFQGAVSNSTDEYLNFYFPEETFLQTGALRPGTSTSNMLQVKNYRLDEVAAKWEKPAQLIKIDVEGAEMDVLLSGKELLSKWHPDLLIEVHGFALPEFGYSSQELLQFLHQLGYVEERIQISGHSREDYFQSFFYYK